MDRSEIDEGGKGGDNGGGLPFSCFDSEELAELDRFDVTRECVRPLCNLEPLDLTRRESFDFAVRGWNIGGLLFGTNRLNSGGVRLVRNARSALTDGDAVQLFLYRRGGFCGENADERIAVGPGDIGLLDLGRGFDVEHAPRSDHLTLVIPRALLVPRLTRPRLPAGLVLKRDTTVARLLATHLQTLTQVLPSASADEADEIADTLLALIAASLGPGIMSREPVGEAVAQATLGAIRDYIEARLDSPQLNVDALCRHFGRSRAYVYRLFQPFGGIRAYIQERRLVRCFRQLTAPRSRHVPIIDVAFGHGFTNQSHFSRLFRQRFGLSPSDARSRAWSRLEPEREREPADYEWPLFHRWFQAL